jgi:hypothetical protein
MAGAQPQPGQQIALEINDAGRAALGGSMGPAIKRIEGLLVGTEADEYLVSVRGVHFFDEGWRRWSGERVRISSGYVSTSYRRQFSRTRSVALGAAVAASLVLMAGPLNGFGVFGPDNGDGNGPVDSARP